MTRRVVAVTAWLVTVSMTALWVWVLAVGGFLDSMLASLPAEEQAGLTQGWFLVTYAAMAGIVIVTLANATIGLILASRRGGGRMGAILLAGAAAFAAVPFGYAFGGTLLLRDPLDPVANALFLLGPASFAFGYSLILPVVALTFPDGRLPSQRWRWPGLTALGALTAATILVLVKPGTIENVESRNPFGIDGLPAWFFSVAGPLNAIGIVLISALGIGAVVTRYRRGSGIERQQLRWFVAAVLLAAVPITVSPLGGGPGWFLLAFPGVVLVPVSVWIAVTRYHLYEIDRLISRGLSWAVLSGLLVAVYAGAVLVLQSLLGGVTQGETLTVAGSTLLAAALFQPLRRRIQVVVDRRFNRARYDAERTASDFAERLRDEVDLVSLSDGIAIVVDTALRPTTIGVWIRKPVPSTPSSLMP